MKIISCEEYTYEYIITDASEYNTFRRHSAEGWEQLLGDSWEPEYEPIELEAAYQEFKRKENE